MVIPVSATSKALQAAINKFLGALAVAYKGATISAMVIAGFTATMATVSYTVTKGGKGLLGGDANFAVPGPEVGVGAPFLLLLVLFALFKATRLMRDRAV